MRYITKSKNLQVVGQRFPFTL